MTAPTAIKTDFRAAALDYLENRGWATHPLRFNDDGFPKVAIVPEWQTIQANKDQVMALPWDWADGIGIIGGENSGSLTIIDVDDEALAAAVAAYVFRHHKTPLLAWTARHRVHVYVLEPQPSRTRKLDLVYEGRRVLVEWRSSSAYVAAPPSPGYSWANADFEPLYSTLSDVWTPMAMALGLTFYNPANAAGVLSGATAGYPRPWQKEVGQGERNDALFVEACRLAEAGMPYDEAETLLRIRFQTAYQQGGMDAREVVRTLQSAYRHVGKQRQNQRPRYVGGAPL